MTTHLTQSKSISINKKNYTVCTSEYNKISHDEFNHLILLDSLPQQERIIGLLTDLKNWLFGIDSFVNLAYSGLSHGGFIPINLSPFYRYIVLDDFTTTTNIQNYNNLITNSENHNINNIILLKQYTQNNNLETDFNVIYFNDSSEIDLDNVLETLTTTHYPKVIVSKTKLKNESIYHCFPLIASPYIVYIIKDEIFLNIFLKEFKHYLHLDDNTLHYDNLIHLCMIVKNAGDTFENVLTQNLPFIDRWTIIDTGSTDNTINIINKVLVPNKKGQLYQEPFINFRDSRNNCLDLASTSCKFNIMLDDTYILQGNLRNFLETTRSDQFSDSFSLYIQSNDSQYVSNRIIKSITNLRYIYKLHEVITPHNNKNVIIPLEQASIFDLRTEYMETRTMDRKEYDLKILHEMLLENPEDPRALYYLGQTYNLLNNFEIALKYFVERINHPNHGFHQERIDACFEASRIMNFKLNYPWKECEQMYLKTYEMDNERPDSLYFIGIHYYTERDYDKAYQYMKKAYEIGYPLHKQYSLKPTLSFFFLPKFLTELCFVVEDFKLGQEVATFFMEINKHDTNTEDYYTISCWKKIFNELLKAPLEKINN